MAAIKYVMRRGLNVRIRSFFPDRMKPLHSFITLLSRESVDVYEFNMMLLPQWADMTRREIKMWEREYLIIDLKGKTVLDIGAGCGETAAFFLHNGAKKVIAIEGDKYAVEVMKENISRNGMNVEPICSRFNKEHIEIKHDFMKVDCEGGERELLNYHEQLGPCVVEAHNNYSPGITQKLASKFSFAISERLVARDTFLLKKL